MGRLVEAAITQFAARGIDATSVEQLCDAAGFTRGAFYSNFASKDDLCTAIIEACGAQNPLCFAAVFTFCSEPCGPVFDPCLIPILCALKTSAVFFAN